MQTQTAFFRLKVFSPLHIGCDEVYEPTAFVVDEAKKELISFDPFDFLAALDESDLKKFSEICQKGTIVSLLEVYKFIRQHADKASGERVAISPDLIEHYKTTLALSTNNTRTVQQELNNFKIERTAFNPITNLPYIPGSAIKGSLRTAVLNLRNKGGNQPPFSGKSAAKELQEYLLAFQFKELHTDPFRLVRISDFFPVSEAGRRIVYAVDRKKKPSEKEASAPYQILEIVETGAEFIGTISVTKPDQGAGIRNPINMDELFTSMRVFYLAEKIREDKELSGISVPPTSLPDNSSLPIRLGRHSGAECVSILGRRKIKILQGKGNPSKDLDHATTVWLAANSKKPTTNKYLRPFGWVVLEEIPEMEWRKLAATATDLENQRMALLAERAEQEKATRASRFAREAEQARLEQEKLAEAAKQRLEKELYPWRGYLPALHSITDWGQLKQFLENEAIKKFQTQDELASAVCKKALDIRSKWKSKWEPDRDQLIADWLAPASLSWEPVVPVATQAAASLTPEETIAIEKIMGIKDWGAYQQAKITPFNLPRRALQALAERMKTDWKCAENKAKQDKKDALKLVNGLLRQKM